ncbi:hypothetical protein BDF14DRAFT_1724208 [Spinellus fusiger]|nr:hypothetical protein BDF14DRAFT_1724208 [Spinellus fusiger]
MLARVFARTPRLARPCTIRRGSSNLNEPGGYLFSEKAMKEDWEDIYCWGMGGGMALMSVALIYKPDSSVMTWARKEAEKSLKEKGVCLDFPRTTPVRS